MRRLTEVGSATLVLVAFCITASAAPVLLRCEIIERSARRSILVIVDFEASTVNRRAAKIQNEEITRTIELDRAYLTETISKAGKYTLRSHDGKSIELVAEGQCQPEQRH